MTASGTIKLRASGVTSAATRKVRASGTSSTGTTKLWDRTGGKWLIGYMPGWDSGTLPVSAIDWSTMTHVAIFSAIPVADGTLNTTFSQADSTSGVNWAKSVADAAKAVGVRPVITVGGGGYYAAFSTAISTSGLRATLQTNLFALVDAVGAAGVDLDLEGMNATDMANIVALGASLKAARPTLLLTIPVGGPSVNNPTAVMVTGVGNLATSFDQINIMGYDMYGGFSGWTSWHNSPLYGETASTPMSIDYAVAQYLAAGIPAAKLGIGAGAYGAAFAGVTAPRQAGWTVRGADGTYSYTNIVNTYLPAMTRVWDSEALVPYLTHATGTGSPTVQFLSYDDAESLGQKAAYIRAKGLGGMIIWQVPEQYDSTKAVGARHPVMTSAAAALAGATLLRVTPPAVTFEDQGGSAGTYTVPTKTGVGYYVGGTLQTAGSHSTSGSVTVTASAATGYEVTSGATASWSHTYAAGAVSPVFLSAQNVKGFLTTATVPALSSVTSTDRLIAVVTRVGNQGTLTTPSGWTVSGEYTTATPSTARIVILTAPGSANASTNFAMSSSGTLAVTVAAYRYAAAPSACVFTDPATASTSTIPTRATAANGASLISWGYATNGTSGSFDGHTNRSAATGNPSHYVADEVRAVAGAAGTRVFTNSQSTTVLSGGFVLELSA